MTSDFSLQKTCALIKWHARHVDQVIFHYTQDWKKFYFQTAQLFDLKIECQIFKCRDFETKISHVKIWKDQDLG